MDVSVSKDTTLEALGSEKLTFSQLVLKIGGTNLSVQRTLDKLVESRNVVSHHENGQTVFSIRKHGLVVPHGQITSTIIEAVKLSESGLNAQEVIDITGLSHGTVTGRLTQLFQTGRLARHGRPYIYTYKAPKRRYKKRKKQEVAGHQSSGSAIDTALKTVDNARTALDKAEAAVLAIQQKLINV